MLLFFFQNCCVAVKKDFYNVPHICLYVLSQRAAGATALWAACVLICFRLLLSLDGITFPLQFGLISGLTPHTGLCTVDVFIDTRLIRKDIFRSVPTQNGGQWPIRSQLKAALFPLLLHFSALLSSQSCHSV